jgi:hypothetical protein
VPQQAGHLDQREIGAEPDRVDRVRGFGHTSVYLLQIRSDTTVPASFEFEASSEVRSEA